MSRPDVPTGVAALEFVGFAESETYALHERTIHGPPLGADVRVLVCSSLAPVRAAEMLEQIARNLRRCEPVAERPSIAEVRRLLCRIGGANA